MAAWNSAGTGTCCHYGLKLHLTDSQGEFVTPTGAAIAAAIRTSDRLPKHFTIEKTGLGAGKRNYDRPGFLRAILIREEQAQADIIWKLETTAVVKSWDLPWNFF